MSSERAPSDVEGSARRAGRPPRLRREAVVAEAIALADIDGLTALSMPKLARRLGVGTMTLYGYVASKQELLDLMAASLLQSVHAGDAGPWRERARHYFRSLRIVARDHPALAALLAAGRIDGRTLMGHLEALIDGAPPDVDDEAAAARALVAALAFTTGTIIWDSALPTDASPASPVPAPTSGPRRPLQDTAPAPLRSMSADEQFEWGLDVLLATS